jgi:glycosyltransferase involved in cell wall biosynthesis
VKVLHVIKHCGHANGNVNAAVDLACAQAKAGFDVTFASAGGALERVLRDNSVKIIRTLDTGRDPFRALWTQLVLIAAVLRLQPQIIHAHMVSSLLLCKIPRALSRARLVATVHNAFEANAWLMGWADRTIAVSSANARDLIARGLRAERIRVVCNGPIGSPRLAQPAQDIELEKPAIVTVCGLHPRKRVEDLIDAASIVLRAIGNAHFYVVGEGPDQARLAERCRALGITRSVHFVGYQGDPLSWMRAADVFVLASEAEPFGLALAEARSQGCAIVATNVDGIPEVLEHGKAGILVPPRSPEDLARAMKSLLSSREAMEEFRARAKAGCGWLGVGDMQRRVSDVYLEVVGCENQAKSLPAPPCRCR